MVNEFKPDVTVLDPISSLMAVGEEFEVRSTLVRMVDFLKINGVTTVFTDLKHSEKPQQSTMVSSLVDTWILLEDVEANGESNRILRIIKSRGMAHSNQIREFLITSKGIEIIPPYIGPSGVLTGSARYAQESKEKAEAITLVEELDLLKQNLANQKKVLDAEIKSLQIEFEDKTIALKRKVQDEERRKELLETNRKHQWSLRTMNEKEGGRKNG